MIRLAVILAVFVAAAAHATVPMPRNGTCSPDYLTVGDYCFPNKYMTAAATNCSTSTSASGTTTTTCRQSTPPYKTTTCTSTTNAAGTTRTVCRQS
jgi:hypothetical protein